MKKICKLNKEIFEYTLFNVSKTELLYKENIVYVRNMNIKDILKVDDCYIRLYLLIHNDVQEYELDKEDIESIVNALGNINVIYFGIYINESILLLCKNKFKNLSIDAYIKILSSIKLKKKDVKYYRKYFGYSVIYKKYKQMIENIYSDNFSVREIGLMITLLNNEKLCFNRLLDTFVRLNEYIENNILDKNLVSCCTVLRSLLIYVPRTIADNEELLYGLMVYIINILCKSSNFKFFNLEDTSVLVKTIRDICRTLKLGNEYRKVAFGLFKECIDNIIRLILSNTNIYEEIVSLIALLDCLGYLVELIFNKGKDKEIKKTKISSGYQFCEMTESNVEYEENYKNEESSTEREDNNTFEINFLRNVDSKIRLFLDDILNEDLFRTIEGYKLPDSFCLGYNELKEIKKRFYTSKYRTLNTITRVLNVEIDRVFFFNDLYNVEHPSYILKEINDIQEKVSWADLIILSSNSSVPSEFIGALFSEVYTKNYDHMSYIYLFISSLKNDYETVLYTSIQLANLNNYNDSERYWELFVTLYMKYINEEDTRIQKSRLYIVDKIIKFKNDKILNNIIRFLLKNIEEHKSNEGVDKKDDENKKYKKLVYENNNIISFLYIIIYNITEVEEEVFKKLFSYLTFSSKSFKESKISKNIKLYHSSSEVLTKKEITFDKDGIYVSQMKEDINFPSKQMIYVSLSVKLLLIYKPRIELLNTFKDYRSNFYFYVPLLIYFKIQNSTEEHFNNIKLMMFDIIFSLNGRKQKEIAKILNLGKFKLAKSSFYKNYVFMDKLFTETFK